MSKFITTLLSLIIALPLHARIQQESHQVIFSGEKIIKPGTSFEQPIHFTSSLPSHRYLRITGNGIMPGRFAGRGESRFRDMEFLIDDCLDSLNTHRDKYALNFVGAGENFERCAYFRIPGDKISSSVFCVEVMTAAQNLHIAEGGRMNIELQVYYPSAKRHKDDIYDSCDTTLTIKLPEGSYGYRKIVCNFSLPVKPATVLMKIAGSKFTGVCRMEAPRLTVDGKAVADFAFTPYVLRPDKVNYWVGVNMLSKSWPLWSLSFNGKEIFRGHIFDRASNVADFYIPLPENLPENGRITLTLEQEDFLFHVPYRIHSIELIEQSAEDVEIVSIPKFVNVGDSAGILIEINSRNTTIKLKPDKHYKWERETAAFQECGLYVLRFKALKSGVNIPVEISDGKHTLNAAFTQFLHTDNKAYLSSGDEIYMDKQPWIYDYFFKWYFSARIGNWYQFRPSYQWSGFRKDDNNVMTKYFHLLNKMNVPFAWQVEGRTLAGSELNPPLSLLKSPMFQGKQAHENDGGYYYWNHFLDEGLFTDIRARYLPLGGIFAKHRPIYTEYGKFVHYDPYGVKDMADGANTFVRNLASSRGESIRHTGPSTMFRYLYRAGYEWLGAEQMYGPEDVILSALRGASKAYGKDSYGSLHAMQWGSFPFTDPLHALRFYQSLALSYMHGSTHINTEEGLWTDEYIHDRYSEAGKRHRYVQNRILDYFETHSRHGSPKSNIAILQGRNCPWKCFGRSPMWSQKDDRWAFNYINESFDLLHVFYPDNILNSCAPEGWFSSSPYGTVDILPVEAGEKVMNSYKVLIFLGWNNYDENDFKRLMNFVHQGGTLLLSAVHLNTNLQPDGAIQRPANDRLIREMLGEDYLSLHEKTNIPYGSGQVIYFPQPLYPAQKEIRTEYEQEIRTLAAGNARQEYEKGMIIPDKGVNFTCWDEGMRRTLYLLNVDWKNPDKIHKAELKYGESTFEVNVRNYNIETIHCSNGVAIHPLSNTTDILSITEHKTFWEIKVQSAGNDSIEIFNSLNNKKITVQIKSAGENSIKIRKQLK